MRGLIWNLLLLLSSSAAALESVSIERRYRVRLDAPPGGGALNAWQSWNLVVTRLDGGPLDLQSLAIAGGMPSHGHDLPTLPALRPSPRPEHFWIDGLRFHMPGTWQISILIADRQGADRALFTFEQEAQPASPPSPSWSPSERASIQSLALSSLPSLAPDPTNRFSDDPRAVALGHRLFFEKGLSRSGQLACASCHDPKAYFTDGRKLAVGEEQMSRNTPTLVGSGFASWFFWDGRRDSLWAQALVPLESAPEMHSTRLGVLRSIAEHPQLGPEFEALVGPLPPLKDLPSEASPLGDEREQRAWQALTPSTRQQIDQAFAAVGKIIAAYERRLQPAPAPFDRFAARLAAGEDGGSTLSPRAQAGLRLFIAAESQCMRCHNGPLLSNGEFHNIGTGSFSGLHLDYGRAVGLPALLSSEFTCQSPTSDKREGGCPQLDHLNSHDESGRLMGAYKVPSLRGLSMTAPYMHDGRYATLRQAVAHYRDPGVPSGAIEFRPSFDWTSQHIAALVEFLESLSGGMAVDPKLLEPPE